jgi:hypothetical protein
VNLIDAAVGLFVMFLIPVAYGAFLLFRVPLPTITSIQPTQITENQETTVLLVGENFRPFLRARVGTTLVPFLIQDPMHAELRLPPLPVGAYTLSLYNEMQELLVKPDALSAVSVVVSGVLVDLQANGYFFDLGEPDVSQIEVGAIFGNQGEARVEVLAVGSPRADSYTVEAGPFPFVDAPRLGRMRVPAIVKVTCALNLDSVGRGGSCSVGTTVIMPDATIMLPKATGSYSLFFLIETVRPADSPVTQGVPLR